MAVELGLLGEVTAHVDGRAVELGPARQRCVLAALAVDVNRVVPAERLMRRVWGTNTPRRGRATLHSHISRLRHALPAADGVQIVLRSGGYALVVDQADQAVDLHRFHDLRARAHSTDDAHEVALLTEALALWRGEPLTGLSGDWVEAERDRLQQELLAAGHDLADARLRIGHGEELVAELAVRTAQYPLDERVARQYLLALHRAGRSADALDHYQQLRQRLVEELGADPGAPLRELHRRILAADPTLTSVSGPAVVDPVVVPRQLPAAPPHFTGRDTDLAALTATLDETQRRTVVISALAGAGGIGKTWLAVHWAHRQLDRFPDGQLFVDLRGFSPDSEPVAPTVAVRGFLDALGVAPSRIPVDPQAQTGLFRSLVAQKQMLIVLDNAATADQVVPLLPGSPTCTVLVTGRTRLASLIDRHGARHVRLDALTREEARALLAARLGTDRVAAEPDAVDELVELCGGYPLALSITARDAATRPAIPLAEVAAELRELGLEMLDHDTDPSASLPAVLSWSLHHLTDEQRIVFGLLGIAPGPDTTLLAVISLTGLPPARARRALTALEEASLVERRPHSRYRLHDLVRLFARERAAADVTREDQDAAEVRVLTWYRDAANAADRLLRPRERLNFESTTHSVAFTDEASALEWLGAEEENLTAAVTFAERDHPALAWQIAAAMYGWLYRRYSRTGWIEIYRRAAAAAVRAGDVAGEAMIVGRMAIAYGLLGDADNAEAMCRQGFELRRTMGDRLGSATALLNLAAVYINAGRPDDAIRVLHEATAEARGVAGREHFTTVVHSNLAEAYQLASRPREARLHYERAVEASRDTNLRDQAQILISFAAFRAHCDDLEQALSLAERGRHLATTTGDEVLVAEAREQLGLIHLALAERDRALDHLYAALVTYDRLGHRGATDLRNRIAKIHNKTTSDDA